jgi:hypothetical protein
MRNFYYVVSFNLTNPLIKTMLHAQNIAAVTGSIMDFKLRSKLFLSYSETVFAVNEDFNDKLKIIYPDSVDHNINLFSVTNPSILPPTADAMDIINHKLAQKFYQTNWDDNCTSVLFFADNSEDDEEMNGDLNSWLLKYEIFFIEDAIEISKNGNYLFSTMNVPQTEFTSTYH